MVQPWPWWLSGLLIGLVVPLLYLLSGKAFGISTSFQQVGAMCLPFSRLSYFRDYDWKAGFWRLVFVLGIGCGGFLGVHGLSESTVEFLPSDFASYSGVLRLFLGGFLVGFGTRYAGGCTSGHAITGIANFNGPSVVATIFFFVGGLGVTWVFGNLIF